MGLLATLRRNDFKPNVPIRLDTSKYTVKTADSIDEVKQALRLRYCSFYSKIRRTLLPMALDVTPYELGADHLIVKEGDDVVGTYRLRCSTFCGASYFSLSEFDVSDFLIRENGKVFVELGRACIDPTRRQGAVIMCLWRGIQEYMKAVQAQFLFGCTSVFTSDPEAAAQVQTHLIAAGFVSDAYVIEPHLNTVMPNFEKHRGASGEVGDLVPPLLTAYLKMGARVYGDPAWDPFFRCADFFTILRVSDLGGGFARRL